MVCSIFYNTKTDYVEIFFESGVENYADSNEKDSMEIFRAEDDNRIVGIGIYNPKESGFIDAILKELSKDGI